LKLSQQFVWRQRCANFGGRIEVIRLVVRATFGGGDVKLGYATDLDGVGRIEKPQRLNKCRRLVPKVGTQRNIGSPRAHSTRSFGPVR
jgi:hypothetical protein